MASACARTSSVRAQERVVRDLLAVDLDPFVKAHDVGRGVSPVRSPPRAGWRRAWRRWSLAVRAGDVNELQLPLRVSEPVEQGADACEPRLRPAPVGRVDIGEGFVDVHARSLPVTATGGHRRTAENTPLRPSIQTIRISAAPVTANCTLREASWARKNAWLARAAVDEGERAALVEHRPEDERGQERQRDARQRQTAAGEHGAEESRTPGPYRIGGTQKMGL